MCPPAGSDVPVPVQRVYPSTGMRPQESGDVTSTVDPQIGLETDGFAIFAGDDTGTVHRWEITKASLLACGLTPIGPQLRSDSFVERRLPKRRIRSSQARMNEMATHRLYKRYQYLPVLTELSPLHPGCDVGVAWCGSWRAHFSALSHVTWIDENSTVMTAASDGLVRLWDAEVRVTCCDCFDRLWCTSTQHPLRCMFSVL